MAYACKVSFKRGLDQALNVVGTFSSSELFGLYSPGPYPFIENKEGEGDDQTTGNNEIVPAAVGESTDAGQKSRWSARGRPRLEKIR